MKKTVPLFVLLLTSFGCGPDLVYYPPTQLNPVTVQGLRVAAQGAPSNTDAMNSVLHQVNKVLDLYEAELYPVALRMYESGQLKEYKAMNELIARARVANAQMFAAQRELKDALAQLREANGRLPDESTRRQTEAFLLPAERLADDTLIFSNILRQYLDIAEGYDRARREWNRSFLTAENEARFNALAREVRNQGVAMSVALDKLAEQLLELLSRGGEDEEHIRLRHRYRGPLELRGRERPES